MHLVAWPYNFEDWMLLRSSSLALQVCLLSIHPGSAPDCMGNTISTHVGSLLKNALPRQCIPITNIPPSSKFLKISRYA